MRRDRLVGSRRPNRSVRWLSASRLTIAALLASTAATALAAEPLATPAATPAPAAAPANVQTLGDVIAYTYYNNPGIQSERAALRSVDEDYVIARSNFGLNASISGGATNYDDTRSRGGGHSNADTNSLALSITQPLFTGGRAGSRMNEAEANIMSGRANLRRSEMELIQKVTDAYVAVLRDQEILKIRQDTIAVLSKERLDTGSKFKVRDVTLTDVNQSAARLAQARTELANAEAQLAISRATFYGIVGQYPGQLTEPQPLEGVVPATIDQALDAAEANNPTLAQVRYAELGARARIMEARAGMLPSVSVRYDIQHTPYLPYAQRPYDTIHNLTVNVSQPLYTGGQVQAQVRQALDQDNRARYNIDDVRLQVIQNVSIQWEQLIAARRQISTLMDEVRADEIAFNGVKQEEKLALRSTIEVLNAELELTNARQQLVRARYNEYLSRIGLLTAIGLLSPQMLAPVTPYDPNTHFQKVREAGSTPLDIPARILDAVVAPQGRLIGPERRVEAGEGTKMPSTAEGAVDPATGPLITHPQ